MSNTVIVVSFYEKVHPNKEVYEPILALKMSAPPNINKGDLITINEKQADRSFDETLLEKMTSQPYTHRVISIRNIFSVGIEGVNGYLMEVKVVKAQRQQGQAEIEIS